MIAPYRRNLLAKGYTNTLIDELVSRNPQRLMEMIEDPWSFPYLGDRSAPLQYDPPAPRLRLVLM